MHVTYLKRILLLFFLTKSPFLLHLSAGDQVTKVADDSLLKFHNTKNLKRKIVKLIQLIMVLLFFIFFTTRFVNEGGLYRQDKQGSISGECIVPRSPNGNAAGSTEDCIVAGGTRGLNGLNNIVLERKILLIT